MALDTQNRPNDSGSDELDPEQRHYDDTFNRLTSAEHMDKDGVSPWDQKPGNETTNDDGKGTEGKGSNKETSGSGRLKSLASVRSRAINRLAPLLKNKWLVGAGVGGSGLVGLILLLLLLTASFKIPHLVENITQYQFARVFQQAAKTNDRVTAQKIAVDAADDSMYGKLKGKYTAASGKVSEKWSLLDKYRPNKVIANMQGSDTLKFNYSAPSKVLGRQRLLGVTIGSKSVLVQNTTTTQKLIPGYKFIGDVKLANQFGPALKTALKADDVGPIIRGQVAKEIRQRLGIGLVAWTVGKYSGLSEEKAQLQLDRDAHEKISSPDPKPAATSSVKEGVQEVQDAENAAVTDDNALKAAEANDGNIASVEQALTKSTTSSVFQKTLGVANGVYALATPVCIIYDGSISESGSTVDSQSAAQEKTFYFVSSAADQERDGTDSDAVAVGAVNTKLKDINDSNAIRRESGAKYDTSGTPGAQSSAGGSYTLFNAIFGGGAVGTIANGIANHTCPALTNTDVALGVAGVNIAAIIGSGGGAAAAEGAAETIATKTTTTLAEKVVEKLAFKKVVGVSSKLKSIGKDSIKSGAKIAAATLLAKMIVASKAGYINNGLEQGADFANMADAGGNLHANDIEREQFYGRPLTQAEIIQAANNSTQYVLNQNEQKSAYQRYFALSNPQSLLTHLGITLSSTINIDSVSNMLDGLRNLFNPLSTAAKVAVSIKNPTAFAATATDTANYTNVQWGWTNTEESILNRQDHQILDNQLALDHSGLEDEIASTYGKCFDDATTIGTLLEDGSILRDDNGNVVNDTDGDPTNDNGLCSPNNLGTNNSKYGDMVYRWRLAQRDNNGLDDMNDRQNITEDVAATNSGGGSSFRIASFNVHGASHTPGAYKSRMQNSINTISSNNLDIVGLQEFEPVQRTMLMASLGTKYDIYPDNGGSSVNSIIWDKSKFTKVNADMMPNLQYFGGSTLHAPWVRLRDNTTKQEFYVLNTHDPANTRQHPNETERRYRDALAHVDFINKIGADGTPILFTGDFNSGYTLSSGNGSAFQNKAANLTYCILTKDGTINDSYDVYKSRSVKCPNPQTPPDSGHVAYGGIDHVYISKGITVEKYFRLPPGVNNNGSDHPTLVNDVTIPAASSSNTPTNSGASKDGWQWPIAKSDYTGLSECWNTFYDGGHHAGQDIRAASGTNVYAAHDGTVVWYKYDPAGGNILLINTGAALWYNYQHLKSAKVKPGDHVKAGQLVAISDNTGGHTTGAHLHFGIAIAATVGSYANNSQTVNPLNYLPNDRDTSACK